MNIEIITVEKLRNLLIQILTEYGVIRTAPVKVEVSESQDKHKYLRSKEVRKLLNVSDNKLRTMRNNREIPFTRIGKTLYYPQDKIVRLLEKNTRSPDR